MVLLHVLETLAPETRWKLVVAHFNHRLRGHESDADERFVRDVARRLNLDFVAGAADVRAVARQDGVSIEMAARRCRHEFFAHEARENGARRVVLAHHAEDQVELFFLRLLRGSGSQGLAGMKIVSPSPCAPAIRLVRPLIDCSRGEIDQFAKSERISFREDSSNSSSDHLRNRIRRELLPLLRKKYQPALNEVVLREMEILSAENDVLEEGARRWLAEAREPFSELPLAIQRRVVQRQLEKLSIGPDFDRIEFLRRHAGRSLAVTADRLVVRDGEGMLRIERLRTKEPVAEELRLCFNDTTGRGRFGGLSWNWTRLTARSAAFPKFVSGTEWFDADQVGEEVILRHWRPGDRFQPIGMKHAPKLQDLFTNLKVPRAERGRRVVATTSDGRIWWVEGLRIGEEFKLRPSTKIRLRWQCGRRHPICGVE